MLRHLMHRFRHSQCSVKSEQNGFIVRIILCCEICIFLDKENILFSVLTPEARYHILLWSPKSPDVFQESDFIHAFKFQMKPFQKTSK